MAETGESKVPRRTAMDYRKRMCAAMDFIRGQLDRASSLEEIAGSAAFSPYHFNRVFRAVYDGRGI